MSDAHLSYFKIINSNFVWIVYRKLSAISYQLSAISYQLLGISY
ncbi:hypothetical protein [Moorena sp. SIO4E2]|nr:hypothetical protein [Moorena sp. SIO4E2]